MGGLNSDTLDGGTGNDTMAGGGDSDTYVIDLSGNEVLLQANLDADPATVEFEVLLMTRGPGAFDIDNLIL